MSSGSATRYPKRTATYSVIDNVRIHAVCAVLLKAMEHGRDIVVEGIVSPKLLDGLETLQAIWHRRRPRRYQGIRICANEESEATPVTRE